MFNRQDKMRAVRFFQRLKRIFLLLILCGLLNGCKEALVTSLDLFSLSPGLSGVPSNPSSDTALSVQFEGYVSYMYKVGLAFDCTNPVGYSAEINISMSITDSLGADGSYTICVVGKDSSGVWLSYASAVTASWVKDTTAPSLTLSQPVGGEMLSGGQSYAINWSASDATFGASPITLMYSIDSGSTWMNDATLSNSGSHTWTIPNIDASTVQVRLQALDGVGLTTLDSSSNFTVDSTSPALSLDNLNGGDTVSGGSSYSINWTASDTNFGGAPINIEYSTDSGSTWNAIASGISNSGSYSWSVPSINSSTVRVRLTATDLVGLTTTAQSVADFTIDSSFPVVTSVSSSMANGSYSAPTTLYIQVTFDNIVFVAGSPYLLLETGNIDGYAFYSTGTGTNTLDFYLTLSETNSATDLEVAVGSIFLNGGTIQDMTSNNADPTLPMGLGNSQSLSFQKNIVIVPKPKPTLSSRPEAVNGSATLNVNIGGTNIDQYMFAIGSSSLDCSIASYSANIPVGVPITDPAGPNGLRKLCVLGRDASGYWQLASLATEYIWYQDNASTTLFSSTINSAGNDGVIYRSGGAWSHDPSSWWIGGEYQMGYREYGYLRFQLGTAIPNGSVINHAHISVVGTSQYNWNSGSYALRICAQKNGSSAPMVTSAVDHPDDGGTTTTLTTACSRWPSGGSLNWKIGPNTSTDVSAIVQELVNTYSGLGAADYIQFWITTDAIVNAGYDISHTPFETGIVDDRAQLGISFD